MHVRSKLDRSFCRLFQEGVAALFQNSEPAFGVVGGTGALTVRQSFTHVLASDGIFTRIRKSYDSLMIADLAPDLGADIGSKTWRRGAGTCLLLCGSAILLSPGFRPLPGHAPRPLDGAAWEESRAQSIAPMAWGGDSGKRMAANSLVVPLTNSPERPTLELQATIGRGDGFVRVLERAGIGASDSNIVASLVASATKLADIPSGTVIPIILGSRASRSTARPLQSLQLRARFDLRIEIARVNGRLQLVRIPIAVDTAPLRIQGNVGESLYRAARAAGVPAKTVETYIRAIASKVSLERDIMADARFDIIVEHSRAETGETRVGKLLFAGLNHGRKKTQLLPWEIDGRMEWFEASGVSRRKSGMIAPVSGARMSSGFGMRFHPILGYSRFHQGVDYAAVYGSPIRAVADGIVDFSGWHGGHGKMVKLKHDRVLGTGYAHMSRIAVGAGARVIQGQVIGYVGSTGLSTGPHLHFEVYRRGAATNPRSAKFSANSLLSGKELQAFQSRLRTLLNTPVNGSQPQSRL